MGVKVTGNSAPSLVAERACELLERHWSIDGDLSRMGSFEDLNFRVCRSGQDALLLKASTQSASAIARQHVAMAHLARHGFRLAVPAPLPTCEGDESACDGVLRVHLLVWVPGRPLSELPHLTPATVATLGAVAAATCTALATLALAPAEVSKWDPRHAPEVVRTLMAESPAARGWLRPALEAAIVPLEAVPEAITDSLAIQIIHGDVTDYNVLASPGPRGELPLTGLIDFGDVTHTWRVCELACAAVAVAARGSADPLGTILTLVRGFHARAPLAEAEADVLWPLVLARAAACAALSAHHCELDPEAEYLVIMHRGDVEALEVLLALPPRLPTAAIRAAIGLAPAPETAGLSARLAAAEPVALAHTPEPVTPLDLGVATDTLEEGTWEDPGAIRQAVSATPGLPVTRWGEISLAAAGRPGPQAPAALALGVALYLAPGTELRAPLDARVAEVTGSALTLALIPSAPTVWLRVEGIMAEHATGGIVSRGERLGASSTEPVRVQLVTDPGLPSAGLARDRSAWLALCPDPSPLLGADCAAPAPPDAEAGRERRAATVAAAQGLYYDAPMEIVRGWRQYLYDAGARPYLDMINNVAVVGHSHPRIAQAARRQFRLLNTNSRFLYDAMARYAERLAELLPEGLDSVFLVNSGSEACDLALQIARVATGRQHIVALAGAYHGWTSGVFEACTSPADNPGWVETKPAFVHLADQPDPYRGVHGDDAAGYVASVARACEQAQAKGGPAAFISEAMLGNQGALVPPSGFLSRAYAQVRAAGGLCIADEIQVGYGRTGDNFWAFEHDGAVPDIVCVAKAAGNGHPIGAVICRPELARALGQRAAFFSSTGGGPVSCEIGLAVLDVIRDEDLQANARAVGTHLKTQLDALATRHRLIGAVHGRGLYLGVDLVRDRAARTPAPDEAHAICERMRELGVIIQPTGDRGNVLKIKPPLCITTTDADYCAHTLDVALTELEAYLPIP